MTNSDRRWWIVGAVVLVLGLLPLALAVVLPEGFRIVDLEGASEGPGGGESVSPSAAAETPVQTTPEGESLSWDRPRFEERRSDRHRMVRRQIAPRDVEDESVLEAMRHVPRHLFIPEKRRGSAYADRPLPIGHGQTISQPYIVAFMTEKLRLEPGDRVLEIGTGSGYQAAVLYELTPRVFTIEIIEELARTARKRLHDLGYEKVQVKNADGYYGWPEHAPFDAIIVTAAAGHVPPPLVDQLKPGGRMIIPVGGVFEVQRLVIVNKDEEGRVSSESVMAVRFVPMTGRAQEGR